MGIGGQDIAAIGLAVAAAGFLARSGYRAVAGRLPASGCGSGCGGCPSSGESGGRAAPLVSLSIGPPPGKAGRAKGSPGDD
ncbi:hypothetical protein [Tautonia sociabilis]|uniref:FeoB-associated Cys-rich membrane protein n=1 Tax=Tautonia sociabilis TaxID=2080755 RepID=A0A432MM67_9BACT|nr:hypothetical protein [Tautonia sociabilis]RUL88287.1 hypothetical protein TsocGM_08100 [Tautonia sociabilis]